MVGFAEKREALRMLDTFSSVGAESFDITHVDIYGQKRGFRPAQSRAQARTSMPQLVESAARRQNNVIVRPNSTRTQFVQLDDLAPEMLERDPLLRLIQQGELVSL